MNCESLLPRSRHPLGRKPALATSLLALLLALSACSDADSTLDPKPARLTPVRVAAVESGPSTPAVVASGVLAQRDQARLSFKPSGVIGEIAVRQGESVRAGQRLAALETVEIDASVTQAREQRDKARRDLVRGRQLFADDVITREQLDDLATASAVAEAGLRAAEYNRGYAVIEAPADGLVLQRLAEPSELVAAGQPVLVVGAAAGGQVLQVGVADRDVVRLRLGDRARLRFDALPAARFEARVVEIGAAADPRTGTFPLELAVSDASDPLSSGMIGSAEIAVSGAGALDYVPLASLVEGRQEAVSLFLFQPDADGATGRVQKLQTAVAFIAGDRVALADSLPAGSQVVTEGAAYVRDGDSVAVVESERRGHEHP
jgi:RND family efflux transporter MFP subunit